MSRRTGRAALAARAGGAALTGALLLTGCAADVDGELRREVANLTDDVNAGDADGVRDSAESLIARTREAVEDNEIDPAEGARIIELATLLRDRYAALQPAEPSPTPEPSETEPETETVTETEEEPEETEAPAASPPPSPRPTQAPPSPRPTATQPPSPPAETLLPEVPEG